MHNVKERLAKIERKHLILACAITVALAAIITTITIFMVASVQAPSASTNVTLSGEVACLPHKNTDGPQTLECAIGLHTDDNRYYALQYSLTPNLGNTGDRVQVTGALTTGGESIYDIVGTIKVENIKN